MEEDFEQDYISEILDDIFLSPCENCNDKAECNYANHSNCCDKKFYSMLKAERIA
jgi:hypothetical protein